MRRIVVLTAVILTLMIVPTSIYALQNPRNSTGVKTPEEIALDFIKDSPTFKFDGITSTLVVEDVYLNKSNPPQYVVTLSFQCLHSGYGNRGGKIVLQVITPHTAVVTIKDGVVLSAVIDGVWDEVAQKNVEDQGKSYVEAIALNWLINAPTFKFDGVEGSATVVDSWLAMTFAAPSFWGVTIEFDCLHAGYGDRTGQILAQMITHHVVTIHVTEGKVTLAAIDNQWDELKQEEIEAPVILTPDQARDIAVRHFLESLGMDPVAPTEWEEENITPEGILGVQKTRYTSGEWVVTIKNAVVWKPTYTVTIEKGDASWEGKVDQDGAVTDGSEPEMPQLIYTTDIARKMCLDYLLEKHPEVAKEIPIEWTEKNLVPEGLVGFTNIEYTSGGWTVTVSAPVVWKPTHTISISYSGEGTAFTWEGTLPQGGPVEETSFSK
jgi:hypothetical protein